MNPAWHMMQLRCVFASDLVMDDIPYSRIRVIYVLRPCAVGFALRNVHDIF